MGAVITLLPQKKCRKTQRKLYLLGKPTVSITDLDAYRHAAQEVAYLPPCLLEIDPQAAGTIFGNRVCANALLRWNPVEHHLSESARTERRIAERAVVRAMLCAGMFRYQP